jgi:hypothetical protein
MIPSVGRTVARSQLDTYQRKPFFGKSAQIGGAPATVTAMISKPGRVRPRAKFCHFVRILGGIVPALSRLRGPLRAADGPDVRIRLARLGLSAFEWPSSLAADEPPLPLLRRLGPIVKLSSLLELNPRQRHQSHSLDELFMGRPSTSGANGLPSFTSAESVAPSTRNLGDHLNHVSRPELTKSLPSVGESSLVGAGVHEVSSTCGEEAPPIVVKQASFSCCTGYRRLEWN